MTALVILLILIALTLYGMKEYYQVKLGVIPRRTPEASLAYIAQLIERSAESGTLLDLSAGYGGCVLELAKRLPTWEVTGVERSPTHWILANFRTIGKNFGNYRFFLNDPILWPLKDYSVVFINQTEKVLRRWEASIAKRLQPGTLLICYNNRLPHIKPIDTIAINPQTTLYIYKRFVSAEAMADEPVLPIENVTAAPAPVIPVVEEAPDLRPQPTSAVIPAMNFTIATWNVNSIKARLDIVTGWLEQHKPDFLMLQEIKCTTDNFPVDSFKAFGYNATVLGQPAYSGVAILSREPVSLMADTLPGNENDNQARFMAVAWQDWILINVYAPNGNPVGTEKFTYKLTWMDHLHTYLEDMLGTRRKFIIGGDFNVIPEPLDARHPEQWRHDALFQKETRTKWRALRHLGLTDVLRALAPETPGLYSFWDYQAGSWHQDNGIRIDHFLASPTAADRLVSCHIDSQPRGMDRPSDHTPVVAVFKK